ncbi:MAG TPA: hypothetical protein DGT53_00335 [Dialister sp.]|nr:hypothetical protein [Dialister sp.]
MKIIIAHFGTYYVNMAGGVEKVTCNLANALVERGHEVTILYRDRKEGNPYFYLDQRVKQYNILFENGNQIVSEKLPVPLRLLREMVRLFSQSAAQAVNAKFKGKQYGARICKFLDAHPADVILSCSIPSAKYVIEDAGCKLPVVEMIHSHPRVQFPDLSEAEKRAVEKCKVMQIILPSGLKLAHQYFPHLPVVVIGNAVAPAKKPAHPGDEKDHHKIICVGNISGTKQQFMLAEAFAKLVADFPDWTLEFWGADRSPYAIHMRKWVEKNHLSDVIHMNGKTDHVEDVYAEADIFCLPSRGEGFSLALSEAMAAGLPAVGFSDCTGVSDLIENRKSGLLVTRSVDELAGALKELMNHPALRKTMGDVGRQAMKQYAPEHIWHQWERVLEKAVKGEFK